MINQSATLMVAALPAVGAAAAVGGVVAAVGVVVVEVEVVRAVVEGTGVATALLIPVAVTVTVSVAGDPPLQPVAAPTAMTVAMIRTALRDVIVNISPWSPGSVVRAKTRARCRPPSTWTHRRP